MRCFTAHIYDRQCFECPSQRLLKFQCSARRTKSLTRILSLLPSRHPYRVADNPSCPMRPIKLAILFSPFLVLSCYKALLPNSLSLQMQSSPTQVCFIKSTGLPRSSRIRKISQGGGDGIASHCALVLRVFAARHSVRASS
jgi:hypothetical protein